MTPFQIIAAILTFTAIGGYINHRYMRFSATIGSMAFALIVSLLGLGLGKLGLIDLGKVSSLIRRIDLSEILLHGMLSFLLFAGALHIHLDDLRAVKWPVAILSTVGVVLATLITGTLMWYGAKIIPVNLPFIYALLFGALISPTDPIAVLAMLKQAGLPKALYVKVGAESLFNDGIGVVVFLTILSVALSSGPVNAQSVSALLAQEALGGAALGGICGWITYRLLRTIDEYKVEVLLTLALVAGGYSLAEYLHVSAPISMVVAGLIIGNHGRKHGMSARTREHLDVFWELIDEVLNAVLFMLIGLEIMIIDLTPDTLLLGLFAIASVLIGRFISVGAPIALMGLRRTFARGTVRILTWGGLRGGLAISMALSLPGGTEKDMILAITYLVVIFSILVQGLSFRLLVRKLS